MANYAILLVCYKHSETKVYNVILILPQRVPFSECGKKPEVFPSGLPVAAFFLVNSAMESQNNNGFTKFPNEWLDAIISSELPGDQIRVFLAIIRQTAGYKKNEAEIRTKKLSEMTKLTASTVCHAVQNLLSRLTIFVKVDNKYRKYAINHDFKQWLLSRLTTSKNKNVVKADNSYCQGRQQLLSRLTTPLYNKENLKKNLKNKECANALKNQKKELPIQKQIPPPIELVIMKFQGLGYPGQSGIEKAHAFFDHYQSNGWKVGGRTKMVDWVAAIRNWIRRDKEFQSNRKTDKLPMIRGKDDGVGGKFEQYKA